MLVVAAIGFVAARRTKVLRHMRIGQDYSPALHDMNFPTLEYIRWAKSLPPVEINLARSGIEHCPPSLLRLTTRDLVANLPVKYGYEPLKAAIAKRYGVGVDRVFTVSGGTSFANWVACAAVWHGAGRGAEALVERPDVRAAPQSA